MAPPQRAQRALDDLIDAGRSAVTTGKEAWPDHVLARLDAGENPVRVFREYRGISQTAMAKAANMNQGSLSAIESGTMPRADTLLRLFPSPGRFHGNAFAKIIIDAAIRRSLEGSSRGEALPLPRALPGRTLAPSLLGSGHVECLIRL